MSSSSPRSSRGCATCEGLRADNEDVREGLAKLGEEAVKQAVAHPRVQAWLEKHAQALLDHMTYGL